MTAKKELLRREQIEAIELPKEGDRVKTGGARYTGRQRDPRRRYRRRQRGKRIGRRKIMYHSYLVFC
jgi:hypothetical protein